MNEQGPADRSRRFNHQPVGKTSIFILLVPFIIIPIAVVLLALQRMPVQSQKAVYGGDVERGKAELQTWGCGSCHAIPGVPGATGQVGPSLKDISKRSFIAGTLENTPENMVQWIMHPQQVLPGTAMPDSGVPDPVARDMAAYLYSIR